MSKFDAGNIGFEQYPLAEKYYSTSPYAFCANNPINFIDGNGMDHWSTTDPNEIQNQ